LFNRKTDRPIFTFDGDGCECLRVVTTTIECINHRTNKNPKKDTLLKTKIHFSRYAGADSTGEVMHIKKSGWWFVMRKVQMVHLGWILFL